LFIGYKPEKSKMKQIKIKTIYKTCNACPTQYEGKLSDDSTFYFRYKWGHLSIKVSEIPTDDIDEAVNGEEIINIDEGDEYDGDMSDSRVHYYMALFIRILNDRLK